MTDTTLRAAVALHLAILVAVGVGLWLAGLTGDEVTKSLWWTPFFVVNAGVLVGHALMAWLASQPAAGRELAWEGRRADLQHSRRVVVEQLRNLDAERDKLDISDYTRERESLLAVGAQASRELDDGVPTAAGEITAVMPTILAPEVAPMATDTDHLPVAGDPTSPATSPPTLGAAERLVLRLQAERDANPEAFASAMQRLGLQQAGPSGEWRGALYTLGVLAMVVGFWQLAASSSSERAPGMSMTGGDSVGGEAAPAVSPVVAELEARLAQDPDDLDALNRLTEIAIIDQDIERAVALNSRAQALAPDDADVRTYRAVMLAFIGRRDESMQLLEGVLDAHPRHLNALFYLGVFLQRTDPARSVQLLERALEVKDVPQIRQQLLEAREAAGAAPVEAAPAILEGTITLSDPAATGQMVFVAVRPAGRATPGMPPYAALKLPPGPFPMTFQITEDSVLPMHRRQPKPDGFQVTVRLDGDGDPMTSPPTDPSALLTSVPRGTSGLTVTLE